MVDGNPRILQVSPIARPVLGEIPNVIGSFVEVMHKIWNRPYAEEIIRIFRNTLATGEAYSTPKRVEYRVDRKQAEY